MKKKSGNKKWLVGTVVVAILAGVFLWWLGQKVEEIAVSTSNTSTSTQTTAKPVGFWSNLFGSKKLDTSTSTSNTSAKEDIKPLVPPTVTMRDLNVTKNETTSSIEIYGRQLATNLKPLGTPRPNEAELLLSLLEKKDEETASKIYQAGKVHLKIFNNLKAMTVPESASALHLKVVQNLAKTMVTLANMSRGLEDPALAVSDGLKYQVEALELFDSIAALNDYFVTKGIVFTADDKIVIYVNVDDQIWKIFLLKTFL